MTATRSVFQGDIVTMDPELPRAGSLVVERGRVVELRPPGAPAPEPGPGGVWIELGADRLLPGFIDAHTHLVHWGLLRLRPDLASTRSLPEALAVVADAHARAPAGRVLIAEGWDESLWPERRYPVRAEIDRITRERPLILRRVCGHMAVANEAALARLPADDPQIDATSGLLLEDASMGLAKVFPPGPEELDAGLGAAQESYHALGVTAVHDMSTPEQLRAFRRAEAAGTLRLSIASILPRPQLATLAASGLGAGWSRGHVRIWGVKFFSDGSLGARTAALSTPYADAPGETGQLLLGVEEVVEAVRLAEAHGIPLAIHAIGDRAVETVLAGFERGIARGAPPLGHRIEHLEMVDAAQLARMAALGIVASMQPNFISSWGRPGQMYAARLGAERTARMNPLRTVVDAGVTLAFGSDAMPAGVLPGLAVAVEPPHPGQRLDPEEAMRAATVGAAVAGHDPDGGWLRPGARADFVVVDGPEARPDRWRVRSTWVGGACVFGNI